MLVRDIVDSATTAATTHNVSADVLASRGHLIIASPFAGTAPFKLTFEYTIPVNFADAEAPPPSTIVSVYTQAEEFMCNLKSMADEIIAFGKDDATVARVIQIIFFEGKLEMTINKGGVASRIHMPYPGYANGTPEEGTVFVMKNSMENWISSFPLGHGQADNAACVNLFECAPMHIDLQRSFHFANSAKISLQNSIYHRLKALRNSTGGTAFNALDVQLMIARVDNGSCFFRMTSKQPSLVTSTLDVARAKTNQHLRDDGTKAPISKRIMSCNMPAHYLYDIFQSVAKDTSGYKFTLMIENPEMAGPTVRTIGNLGFLLFTVETVMDADEANGGDASKKTLASFRPWKGYIVLRGGVDMNEEHHDFATVTPTVENLQRSSKSAADLVDKPVMFNTFGDIEFTDRREMIDFELA